MRQLGYANRYLDGLEIDEIEALQNQRLLRMIEYCTSNSSFYRELFGEYGINPSHIKTIADWRSLPPLMDKDTERRSQEESLQKFGHPFGMHLIAATEDIFMTATTSGTTGSPTFTYTLSRKDQAQLSTAVGYMLNYARVPVGARLLFAHSLGVYATSIMIAPIRDSRRVPIDVDVRGGAESILRFWNLTKPNAAMMTPSLAEYLINRTPEITGQSVGDMGLGSLFTAGEIALSIDQVRARIEREYGCRAYDWMAPSGGALAFSCNSEEYHGLHAVTPDLDLYPLDLVDPESKRPIEIEDGAVGEVIYTSLLREASPLLRFASGDIVRVTRRPCPGCGFTGSRVEVLGRADDMLIVKGANVYPSAMKSLLDKFKPRVTGEMRIILNRPAPRVEPPLRVKLEYTDDIEPGSLPTLSRAIQEEMSRSLRVRPEIEWVASGELGKSMTKTPLFEKHY